jgi:hypothetical protein
MIGSRKPDACENAARDDRAACRRLLGASEPTLGHVLTDGPILLHTGMIILAPLLCQQFEPCAQTLEITHFSK